MRRFTSGEFMVQRINTKQHAAAPLLRRGWNGNGRDGEAGEESNVHGAPPWRHWDSRNASPGQVVPLLVGGSNALATRSQPAIWADDQRSFII